MSAGRAFFDTNVLLYMYGGDAAKRSCALELFREHSLTGSLLVSTQVVQEFYAAGSRKLRIPRQQLRDAATALLECPLIVVGPAHIRSALENENQYGISFWDALIVAAAAFGSADVLYTEDLNDGQRYGAVLVRNPFR